MKRAYYSDLVKNFLVTDENFILGILALEHQFALEDLQRNAWKDQIRILKEQLSCYPDAYIAFEYLIPRMGRRVDNVFIFNGIVFIMEFKVNESKYTLYAKDQVLDYCIDLKNFHSESKEALIVPILIATEATSNSYHFEKYHDNIHIPILCNKSTIKSAIDDVFSNMGCYELNAFKWAESTYKPTPTIIEAAQALYENHTVKDISRSDAGIYNLTKTTSQIDKIIDHSKIYNKKSICFITGVPGAGKTLAGLNIATERRLSHNDENAVFLSGNGPLVDVLREALVRNKMENANIKLRKKKIENEVEVFIQNIHQFRDDNLISIYAPAEHVAVFDEAQRAWTKKQTSKFMKRKKGIATFDMSEPEFLISVMDRHTDWAVIVCLIGGGQEINTGEAGLPEWFDAIKNSFSHWDVYISSQINSLEYTRDLNFDEMINGLSCFFSPDLHLNTSIRSFRSENVSHFVKCVLDNNYIEAERIFRSLLDKYPIKLTRDLEKAKYWIKASSRGTERYGIVASSGGYRLKAVGINTDVKIDAKNWFLNPKDDVRSSYILEDPATEFDIQGLELDWTCVAWDADLRRENGEWIYKRFRGSKWQNVNSEEGILYLKNAYRVLLTRARQGMIILIPKGSTEDVTRLPSFYDETYEYLKKIGIEEV